MTLTGIRRCTYYPTGGTSVVVTVSRLTTNGLIVANRFVDGGNMTTGSPTFPTYITLVAVDGSSAYDVTMATNPVHDLAGANFGSKVAYLHQPTFSSGSNSEIHIVNTNTTGDTLIYTPLSNESIGGFQGLGLAWNLDGSKLAALYWDNDALGGVGSQGFMVMNPDGSGVTKTLIDSLLGGINYNKSAILWYDNSRLVFQQYNVSTGKNGLVLVGLDGLVSQTVSDGSVANDQVAGILPDGDFVVYRYPEFGRLTLAGTYTSLFTPTLPSGFDFLEGLALSPDGTKIAAILRPSGPPYSITPIAQLGIYGIDGSGPIHPLIPQAIDIAGVFWGPEHGNPTCSNAILLNPSFENPLTPLPAGGWMPYPGQPAPGEVINPDGVPFDVLAQSSTWSSNGSKSLHIKTPVVPPAQGPFSFEAWVALEPSGITGIPPRGGIVLNKFADRFAEGGFQMSVVSFFSPNQVILSIGSPSHDAYWGVGSITDTNWHHIVVTCDANGSGDAAWYIDGAPVGTYGAFNSSYLGIGNSFANHAPLLIGTAFTGRIARAAFYNQVLSTSDVSAHYAASASGYDAAVLATTGLVSYWPLNEVSGTIAQDLGGVNNGVYNGGVTLAQTGPGGSNAVHFNGTDAVVTIPSTPSLYDGPAWPSNWRVTPIHEPTYTGTAGPEPDGAFPVTAGVPYKFALDTFGVHQADPYNDNNGVYLEIDWLDNTGALITIDQEDYHNLPRTTDGTEALGVKVVALAPTGAVWAVPHVLAYTFTDYTELYVDNAFFGATPIWYSLNAPTLTQGTPIDPIDVSASFVNPCGGTPTYSVPGGLPPGLTIDPATGIITGTPTEKCFIGANIRATLSTGMVSDSNDSGYELVFRVTGTPAYIGRVGGMSLTNVGVTAGRPNSFDIPLTSNVPVGAMLAVSIYFAGLHESGTDISGRGNMVFITGPDGNGVGTTRPAPDLGFGTSLTNPTYDAIQLGLLQAHYRGFSAGENIHILLGNFANDATDLYVQADVYAFWGASTWVPWLDPASSGYYGSPSFGAITSGTDTNGGGSFGTLDTTGDLSPAQLDFTLVLNQHSNPVSNPVASYDSAGWVPLDQRFNTSHSHYANIYGSGDVTTAADWGLAYRIRATGPSPGHGGAQFTTNELSLRSAYWGTVT